MAITWYVGIVTDTYGATNTLAQVPTARKAHCVFLQQKKLKIPHSGFQKFTAPLSRPSKFVLDAFAYNCMQQKTADRTVHAVVN
jgi:hypothetical protein